MKIIKAGKDIPKWHFVEDNDFPKDNQEVLLYCRVFFAPDHVDQRNYYMGYLLGAWDEKHQHFYGDFVPYYNKYIVAWMELPKRPIRKNKDKEE